MPTAKKVRIEPTQIVESLRSRRLIDGLTHNFYSYPARFSPELTKNIIGSFSNLGDWIFDPFMGGGTSVVESLAMGRNAIGVDINSLAWFVALSKTTPLAPSEIADLRKWASNFSFGKPEETPSLSVGELKRHFPKSFLFTLDNLLKSTECLQSRNTRRLARFVLLKVYQSTLSVQDRLPSLSIIRQNIPVEVDRILLGLEIFLDACKASGIPRRKLTSSRILLNRSSTGIEKDVRIAELLGKPRLVFTSPPYPGVHVLYNKWQIASRKETFLPYYISGMNDSQPDAYYTLGGRSKSGVAKYFDLICESFLSISRVTHPKAIIVQLVGFSDTRLQLTLYLEAMRNAGYKEIFPLSSEGDRLWRDVPNRKWYTNGRGRWDASKEVLLFHTLSSR